MTRIAPRVLRSPAAGVSDDRLTDRYVAAVCRALPPARRAEAEIDIRRRVADEVLHAPDPVAAERHAVSELGDPLARAAASIGQPMHLIGPAYFAQFLRLLGTLLLAVPVTVAVVVAVVRAFAGDPLSTVALESLSLAFTLAVYVCFWTTLAFAIVERTTGRRTPAAWSPDDLAPATVARVGWGDVLADLVLLGLLLTGLVTVGVTAGGDLWPWLVALAAIAAAGLLVTVGRAVLGHWTVALAVANTVVAGAFAAVATALLLTQPLDAVEALSTAGFAAAGGGVAMVVLVICGIVIVSGWWQTLRDRS